MINSRLSLRLTRDFLPFDYPVGFDTASGKIITNGDFLQRCANWTAGFARMKVQGAQRAAVYFDNTIDFASALFGAWRIGMKTLLLSDTLPGTIKKLEHSGAIDCTAGDCSSRTLPAVKPSEDHTLDLCSCTPLDEKAPLVSLLTSGSTGEPKTVEKRLEQLFLEVEGIDTVLDFYELSTAYCSSNATLPIVFSTVTHQHIYGLLFRAFWPLLGAAIMTDKRMHYPESLSLAMHRTPESHPLILVSSPAHLKRLDDVTLFEGLRKRITFVSSSAGPLDETGARKTLQALGRFPFEILGSTETGGIAQRMRTIQDGKLTTPRWQTMPGVEIGIVQSDQTVSFDTLKVSDTIWPVHGRLALRSRQLASSEFETGSDNIELMSDGSFLLTGRSDRIVKVEGKRVSLINVENLLLQSEWISQAKALLITGHRDEIAVVAELSAQGKIKLFHDGKEALTQALRSFLADNLEAVAVPKRWRLLEKLPVNAQGKSPVSLLRDLFDPRRLEWFTQDRFTQPRGVRLRTTLPVHLIWFKGHFPNRPILPGVGILKLTSDAARDFFAFKNPPVSVRNLKFKSMTRPRMNVILEMIEKKAGEVKFTWYQLVEEGRLVEQASGILNFD